MSRLFHSFAQIAIAVMLVAIAIDCPAAEPRTPQKKALLVGVNEYDRRGFSNLQFAERDVTELSAELKRLGFQTVVLTGTATGDARATKANILSSLAKLLEDCRRDDVVIVGLAGHGVQIPLADEKGTFLKSREGKYLEDACFCPVDAEKETASTLVSLTQLVKVLDRKGGVNLLLVDACRVDPGRGGRSISGNELNDRLPENTVLFMSCAAGQEALETKEAGGGHGVFFYHVIKGLQGEAARGDELNWDLLVNYVRGQVNVKAKEWFPDRRPESGRLQTPHMLGNLIDIVEFKRVASVEPMLPEIPIPSGPDLSKPGKLLVEITEPVGVDVVADNQTIGRAARGTKLEVRKTNGPWFWVDIPAGAGWIPAKSVANVSEAATNTLGMKLVWIPPGEFTMGSPAAEAGRDIDETQHPVTLTRGFWLGQHEVTVGEFKRFVQADGYQTEGERDGKGGYGIDSTGQLELKPEYTWKNPGFAQTDAHPVVNVSFSDAAAFGRWLSGKEGRTYVLPTEAQWEYACRAGSTTAYSFGDDPEQLAWHGNVADASLKRKLKGPTIVADDGEVFTATVVRYRANPFGLCDMHGNVWERCSDWYDDSLGTASVTNPTGPKSGSYGVIRGGSWMRSPQFVRSANRVRSGPAGRYNDLGFRLCLVQ